MGKYYILVKVGFWKGENGVGKFIDCREFILNVFFFFVIEGSFIFVRVGLVV